MIRKCNTSNSKQTYTPYNAIRVSEFNENQEECVDYESANGAANEELAFNILKIKECKQQTEDLICLMNQKIISQNESIKRMQEISKAERQKCKQFKAKYHEALINLRRKDQENERLQRCLREYREKYDFMVDSSSNTVKDWAERQKKYKDHIAELEQFIHHQTFSLLDSHPQNETRRQRARQLNYESLKKEVDSTFL